MMSIQSGVKLQEDSIASIKTEGLDRREVHPDQPGRLGQDHRAQRTASREVEPPVDIEELLSKYIFGKV